MANKTKAVVWSLIVIIVILALILVYAFAVQPALDTRQNMIYTAGYQTGQAEVVSGIVNQVLQNGFIEIPVGNNQSLFLAQFDPTQVATQ